MQVIRLEAREYSFDILKAVEQGEGYARDILHLALKRIQFSDKRDRAFVTRLVEGVTERRITLDYIIEKFSKGKNKNLKEDFRILLRMGIYQIHYMDSIPNRAAISETVRDFIDAFYSFVYFYSLTYLAHNILFLTDSDDVKTSHVPVAGQYGDGLQSEQLL